MTRRAVILTTAMALVLSGCGVGQSRLNPFNWFRSGPEVETLAAVPLKETRETRPLVAQITQLVIERTPGGAIIRATGLPPEQGWYDAELVNVDRDGKPIDGVLYFGFHARPPLEPTRVSTVQSRELTVATFVSNITLESVREIRVTGSVNSRSARR